MIAFQPSDLHSSNQSIVHLMLAMPDFSENPYILVPEYVLLSSLPAHQIKRFETALTLMHRDFGQQLTWEQIAEKSAISPYHFHRQFSRLFHETPGQYLSRVRLQRAVSLLLAFPATKVTEIAIDCGYSSSQALAKVLKRELGLTARAIRKIATAGTADETAVLLSGLAHPAASDASEYQLAHDLPCEQIWYPARFMKKKTIPDFDWDVILQKWQPSYRKLCCMTPVMDLERPWKEMRYITGLMQDQEGRADVVLPEGFYWCSVVYLTSDVGYIAAIDGVFSQAEKSGLEVDVTGCLTEYVIDCDPSESGGVTFMFQIPLK